MTYTTGQVTVEILTLNTFNVWTDGAKCIVHADPSIDRVNVPSDIKYYVVTSMLALEQCIKDIVDLAPYSTIYLITKAAQALVMTKTFQSSDIRWLITE